MMDSPERLAYCFNARHWLKKRYWTAFQKAASPASSRRAASRAAGSRRRSSLGHWNQAAPSCRLFKAINRA